MITGQRFLVTGAGTVGSTIVDQLVELAHALQRAIGSGLELEFVPLRSSNAVTRRRADASHARQRPAWKSAVDLDEGLRRLVARWRSERVPATEAGVR